MTAVLVGVLIVGGVALAWLWDGLVLSLLWNWCVVPILHAPVVTVPQALALSLIVSALREAKPADPEPRNVRAPERWAKVGVQVGSAVLRGGFLLLLAWGLRGCI